MVAASSPLRRRGSTLNWAPSISPTPRSEYVPLSGAPVRVPPAIRSAFSGTGSLGVKLGSTDAIISGGGLSAPTDGISLAMVEVVFVKWGPSGFEVCASRCPSTLEWIRSWWSAQRGKLAERDREVILRSTPRRLQRSRREHFILGD